ncbi:MAG: hypothetical protein WDM90_10625 [Ferruginibacter sp.]
MILLFGCHQSGTICRNTKEKTSRANGAAANDAAIATANAAAKARR